MSEHTSQNIPKSPLESADEKREGGGEEQSAETTDDESLARTVADEEHVASLQAHSPRDSDDTNDETDFNDDEDFDNFDGFDDIFFDADDNVAETFDSQPALQSDTAPKDKANYETPRQPIPSTPSPAPSLIEPITGRPSYGNCVACHASLPYSQLARCPCLHTFCRECLEMMFTNALKNEKSWPVRCCRQDVPVEDPQVRKFLTDEFMRRYQSRKVEMEQTNRLYCQVPGCGVFIPQENIDNDTGTCPRCGSKTCAICKNAAHDGVDCPEDEAGTS